MRKMTQSRQNTLLETKGRTTNKDQLIQRPKPAGIFGRGLKNCPLCGSLGELKIYTNEKLFKRD